MLSSIKQILFAIPGLKTIIKKQYWIRKIYIREYSLLHDRFAIAGNIGWDKKKATYWLLSSQLIFWYHKLEKGMCLPKSNKRVFGKDAATEVLRLIRRWDENSFEKNSEIYKASIEVLRSYLNTVLTDESASELRLEIERVVEINPVNESLMTPISLSNVDVYAFESLSKLCVARRSVRNYKEKIVELEKIKTAISIAQLSPSACNRQPTKVHLFFNKEKIVKLLKLQNGNRGFGDTIQALAIITSDLSSFFDETERHEPSLDGGLFLMTFILALQSLGLSSCCLNWCVDPSTDVLGHKEASIPSNEQILTFLAIGYAVDDTLVPLSARRPIHDVLITH